MLSKHHCAMANAIDYLLLGWIVETAGLSNSIMNKEQIILINTIILCHHGIF